MKGNIYAGRCGCGASFKNDENQDGCFCPACGAKADGPFRVSFGRGIMKRRRTYEEARRLLTKWRAEMDANEFNPRKYAAGDPLNFRTQANRWLDLKKDEVSSGHYANLDRYMAQAKGVWGTRIITQIQYGDIEDLLHSVDVSDKTKHDMVAAIRQFFTWSARRERITPPDFPEVRYTLGMRRIVSLEDQGTIIDKVEEIAPFKVWLGIKWMATYVAARPGEFWHLQERDIDVNGYLVFRPEVVKTREPVIIPMLEEDIELYHSLPSSMPDLYFFRWDANHPRTPGKRFGKNLFYHWWKRACDKLGVEGVDLYAGVRHSTVTAAGQFMSAEDVRQNLTQHRTTRAFDRYFQHKTQPTKIAMDKMREARKEAREKGQLVPFKRAGEGDDV